MILCNQTFACIDRKLKSGKDKHKEKFSQSCLSLSGNSTYTTTTTTTSTTSSSGSLYIPPGLSNTEEICKITLEDSCYKEKINLFTSNSICTTISAISNLNRSINVKGQCLSCSLDGLKMLHPQCCGEKDGKEDIITIEKIRYRTDILTTVSQKNDNSLNISLQSSITFSSTWPKGGGKKELVKLSRSASSHSLPVHDQCQRNNYDSNSESNDSSVSTKLESIGKYSSKGQNGTSLEKKHREFSDLNLGSIINASDNLSDDLCDDNDDGYDNDNTDDDNNDDGDDNGDDDNLCDDWDDGHSSQDEVDDLEMKIMEDEEIEREEIEVDLYNLSDHGSDQLNTKYNAVLDECNWSFMDENDKRKKSISKKEKGSESVSVSSCSLSGDEESDDDGSIDRYLMKKISIKKNQVEHHVKASDIVNLY
jgi:hypothetical protein